MLLIVAHSKLIYICRPLLLIGSPGNLKYIQFLIAFFHTLFCLLQWQIPSTKFFVWSEHHCDGWSLIYVVIFSKHLHGDLLRSLCLTIDPDCIKKKVMKELASSILIHALLFRAEMRPFLNQQLHALITITASSNYLFLDVITITTIIATIYE